MSACKILIPRSHLPPQLSRHRSRQLGAAILTALIIVAIATTIAATMMARQQASLVGEEARRHATQARWVLLGAMGWAKIILSEQLKHHPYDILDDPWAVPLKPIPLKSFLAVSEKADDAVFEALLEGSIEDAQAKFNLRNLSLNGARSKDYVPAFAKLLKILNIAGENDIAKLAADNMIEIDLGHSLAPPSVVDIVPKLTPEQHSQLAQYVTLLPRATPINANTTSAEVLSAVIPKLDLASAKSIITSRKSAFFAQIADIQTRVGVAIYPTPGVGELAPLDVYTEFFNVKGSVLWDKLTIEQNALVYRKHSQPPSIEILQIGYGSTMPEKPLH